MKAAVLLMVLVVSGLSYESGRAGNQGRQPVPAYQTSRVSRHTQLLDYRKLRGSVRIQLRGTSLLPQARGTAEVVESKGEFDVNAEFQNLQPASAFSPERLTYVMWAITPEGRSVNLGEAVPEGVRKLKVSL